ncbi:hypothetical protein GCM10007425_09350 [Lysinibacillus alkalisoli]|uniref:DUF309 domain-containing protein n=1 Tax=Lysinibacillus alkalisoli TaxID=1911548 RepID=A0A917G0P5_9BACI|nr:DUF309 domain-containing protein [Lysinibacillus alkalisoli]GGG17101.1 hypothetical protein GCM10007425_09350 [Lysinibacillus alkalisoli]
MHPQLHPLFIDYCAYFVVGDYFECHEVAEEYWKALHGHKKHPLVAYIQIAAGHYHARRGNDVGAKRLLQNAQTIITASPSAFYDYIPQHTLINLAKREQYSLSLLAPLAARVAARVEELPRLDDDYLLHKHTLRDRSDVIAERLRAKQAKQNNRQ